MVPRKISEGKGNATFRFGKSETKADFLIEFYMGQEPIIYLYEKFSSPFWKYLYEGYHKQKREPVRLKGIMQNGNYIPIDNIILISIGNITKG